MKPKKNCPLTRESVLISQSPILERFIHEITCLNLKIYIWWLVLTSDITTSKHGETGYWCIFLFFLSILAELVCPYIVYTMFFFRDKMKYLWWIRYPSHIKEGKGLNKPTHQGRIGWYCILSRNYILEEKEECEGSLYFWGYDIYTVQFMILQITGINSIREKRNDLINI